MTEKARARAVYGRLLEEFGIPTWQKRPAMDELILTILSQNTNDRNRDLAYNALRENYPTWEEVEDAHEDELIRTIRVAGLANQKGPRIQAVLKKIDQEFEQLNLDFMRNWERERVYEYLVNLKGVGPKTASIVMLFSLDLPAFPVDTHVYRVTGRIGIRPLEISVENSHEYLASCFNIEEYRTAHINLINLGRRICKARKPNCPNCPVRDLCLYPDKSDQIIKD
ncbi:MAG: hypothetical protein K8R40_13595 [Anaerolineaceae bacterium]|nr:hypothetical protein [Anaerolineaceae bacterium]